MEFVAFRHLHVKLGRCHMSRKVRIRVQGDLFTFPPELIMSRVNSANSASWYSGEICSCVECTVQCVQSSVYSVYSV